MNNSIFYNSFIKYWLDNYKRQYFKAKLQNDLNTIITIKENIWKNTNLNKNQKKEFWKMIGGVE